MYKKIYIYIQTYKLLFRTKEQLLLYGAAPFRTVAKHRQTPSVSLDFYDHVKILLIGYQSSFVLALGGIRAQNSGVISPERQTDCNVGNIGHNRRSGAAFLRVEFELRVTREENSIGFFRRLAFARPHPESIVLEDTQKQDTITDSPAIRPVYRQKNCMALRPCTCVILRREFMHD